jgi:hypothetical protein
MTMLTITVFVTVAIAISVGLAFGFRATVLLTRAIGGTSGDVTITVTVFRGHDSSSGG